jgi:hypothetical protein
MSKNCISEVYAGFLTYEAIYLLEDNRLIAKRRLRAPMAQRAMLAGA